MNVTIIIEDKAVYMDGGVLTDLDFSNAEIPSNVHSLQWKANVGWIEYIDGSKNETPEIISFLPNWANSCISAFENQVKQNKIEAQTMVETQRTEAIQNQPKTYGTIVI